MEGLKHIQRIREYCDYVERHLNNVRKAWDLLNEKCDFHPFYDDHLWGVMDGLVKEHDISKLSAAEFIQYQEQFFPVGKAPDKDNPVFAAAWENHKASNPHHWENWTKREERFPNENVCHCVTMVCDLWADGLVRKIFERVYPK